MTYKLQQSTVGSVSSSDSTGALGARSGHMTTSANHEQRQHTGATYQDSLHVNDVIPGCGADGTACRRQVSQVRILPRAPTQIAADQHLHSVAVGPSFRPHPTKPGYLRLPPDLVALC